MTKKVISQDDYIEAYTKALQLSTIIPKIGLRKYEVLSEKLYSSVNVKDFSELERQISDKNNEKLVIINEDGSLTNKLESRGVVHSQNLWHREVSALPIRKVKNKEGKDVVEVLVIVRSNKKSQYPGAIGLIAGHVAGPIISLKDAALNEAMEELDLPLTRDQLMQLAPSSKNVRENNYSYTTPFVFDGSRISSPRLQTEECNGFEWVSLEKFEHLVKLQDPILCIFKDNEYYRNIINSLKVFADNPVLFSLLQNGTFSPIEELLKVHYGDYISNEEDKERVSYMLTDEEISDFIKNIEKL